jgi:hypothetical protein
MNLHLMHYSMLFLAHIYSHSIDQAELELEEPMEPELEEPTEPTQAEGFTNLSLDQGKPRCI